MEEQSAAINRQATTDVGEGNPFPPDNKLLSYILGEAESSTKSKQQPERLNIPKVPEKIRIHVKHSEYFDIKVVCIGPYHHGDKSKECFQEVENLKAELAKQYVRGIPGRRDLYNKIRMVVGEARNYYDKSVRLLYDDETFTTMMLVDGCFILQFMYLLGREEYHEMGMTNNLIADVKRDLFLLENQLPFFVLEKLMSDKFQGNVGNMMIEMFINICRRLPPSVKPQWGTASKYHSRIRLWNERVRGDKSTPHLHLLNMARTIIVDPDATNQGGKQDENNMARTIIVDPDATNQDEKGTSGIEWYSYYSAKVLKSKGIRFIPNETGSYSDVKFSSLIKGVLTLPPVFIDTSTRSFLLNLSAFEANHHDLADHRGITSYICFMDSLIDHAEDVMILRTQNVIVNCLGSDELVAEMFNDIAKDLVPNPNTYAEAKRGIQRHCNSKFKKWMAECLNIHCRSPWTLLALFGALFAVILTCAQTYLAAKPPKI